MANISFHSNSGDKMDRVLRDIHYLELLLNLASSRQAKALILTASDEQMNTISELAMNLLKGRVELSQYYKRQLSPRANVIRCLAEGRRTKRRTIALNNLDTVVKLVSACIRQLRIEWQKST